MKKLELERQLIHIALTIPALAVLFSCGREIFIAVTFLVLIIGLLLVDMAFLKRRIGPLGWLIERFERGDIRFPGWGSACYATGVLLAASFLTDINAIAASIIILGIGDGFSTLVGVRGKTKLPHNSKKTLEGSIAFFAASLIGYFFVGNMIIPVAILAAVVESIDFGIDDNIAIPVATTIAFLVI